MAKPSFYSHWKFKMLVNLLNEKKPKVLGHVQMLWDTSAMIGTYKFTPEQVEMVVEWDGEPGKFTNAMIEVGLLDKNNGLLEVHDWADHCPNYVKRKIKQKELKEKEKTEEKKEYIPIELKEDTDIYGLTEDEIIGVILGLDGEINTDDPGKLIVNMVKKYFRDGGDEFEIKDILKRVKDARFYGREKDVGSFKNEKAFVLKKIKEMLT